MYQRTQRSHQQLPAMDVNNKSSCFGMKLDKWFMLMVFTGLFLSTIAGE